MLALSGCKTPGTNDYSNLPFNDTTKLAHDFTEAADVLITYKPASGKFDIGIGEDNNGLHDIVSFSLKELEHYFSVQKHKSLVVVVFEKNKMPESEICSRSDDLTKFFFSAGYRRVVIEQAYGNGCGIWSDKTNPQPCDTPNPHSPSAQGAGGR